MSRKLHALSPRRFSILYIWDLDLVAALVICVAVLDRVRLIEDLDACYALVWEDHLLLMIYAGVESFMNYFVRDNMNLTTTQSHFSSMLRIRIFL